MGTGVQDFAFNTEGSLVWSVRYWAKERGEKQRSSAPGTGRGLQAAQAAWPEPEAQTIYKLKGIQSILEGFSISREWLDLD